MADASLDPEDWAMWHAVTVMRAAVERAVEQRLQRDAGLSLADFDVLRGLSVAEGHRLRAGALADSLGWEKSRISHQVRRMTDRGLLAKSGCPTDGRGTWVELSGPGKDALAAAACGYAEVLQDAFFDRLEPDEKVALHRAAVRVHEGVADRVRPSASVSL